MPLGGGEPRAITELPRGAANPVWAPDGKTLAFTSATTPEDLAPPAAAKSGESTRKSDIRIITEAVYRANGVGGSGFVESGRPAQIWTVAIPTDGAASSPTSADHVWRVRRQQSALGAGRCIDPVRLRSPAGVVLPASDSDLYEVPRSGGEPVRLASIEGSIGGFTLSSDGKRVAFVGTLPR